MTIPPDQKLRREFIKYLKVITSPKNRASLPQFVKHLRANTSRKDEEFLLLCKAYLREFHQLHDFTVTLSPEDRCVNVFFCKKPPC